MKWRSDPVVCVPETFAEAAPLMLSATGNREISGRAKIQFENRRQMKKS